MQNYLHRTSLVLKVTLGIGFILVTAVVLSTLLSFNYSEKLLLEAASTELLKSMDRQKDNLQTVLDEAMKDAELVSHGAAVQGLMRSKDHPDQSFSNENWQNYLERTFSVMIESKGYTQIRFIGKDDGWRELARVDGPIQPGGELRIIQGMDLQQKGHRDYVQNGAKLKHGQTFISSITLNREHGVIQTPWQPTQRFVAPVFRDLENANHKGSHHSGSELLGIVVINTNAERLMHQMVSTDKFDMTLVNSKGGILYHKDEDLCWQFEFSTDTGLSVTEPHTWALLNKNHQDLDWTCPKDHVHATAIIKLGDSEDDFLGLVMNASEEQLLVTSELLKRRIVITGSISLLVALALGLLIVKHLIKPIVLLTDQAKQLVDGERTAIDVSHSQDEVGRLGRTFEILIDSLEEKVNLRTEELVDTQTKIERDANIIEAMNKALAISLYSTSSKQLLQEALDLLLNLDFLAIENQGAAFLATEDPPMLILTAHQNLASPLHQLCARVPFGKCLCGKAAETKKILFNAGCDHGHDISFEGMKPHGHYNVPLLDGPDVLGMLALYIPAGSEYSEEDASFLSAFSDILAGAIRRFKTKEDLRRSMEVAEGARAELEIARVDAVAANESKSAFLANMSHEIRTPMTAILGYTDLLAEGDGSPEDQKDHLHTIKQNGAHLLTIINDILDISKIEAGKMEIEKLRLSLWDIVTDVQDLLSVRATEQGISLHADFEYPLPETIESDPVRLRQVLLNLVGNSIKFTSKGEVRITTSLVDEKIKVEVTDTGIGMSEQQVKKLFQPFSQADASTTRQFGGTGLGLTICKSLTEMMGGGISLESTEGEGSKFTIEIDPGDLSGISLVDQVPQKQTVEDQQFDADSSDSHESARILLAEDTLVNQKLASRMLKKAGHEVVTANNGLEALEMALKQWQNGTPFDVILMDMQMPIMDGYESTKKLREAKYELPIIALTANAMASDREKCEQAGCDDFATKPYQKLKLLKTIAKWQSKTHNLV